MECVLELSSGSFFDCAPINLVLRAEYNIKLNGICESFDWDQIDIRLEK